MSANVTTIASDFAEGFDEIRKEILGPRAVLVLLRDDGGAKAFTELSVVEAGWYSEFSRFHGTTTFHVADLSTATAANFRKATHLIVRDSALVVLNNVLHEMKAETAPPSPDIPWWKVRAEPMNRKYVAPEEI